MPDEIGTEATRPDAQSADDALFGDAAEKADDTSAAVVEEDSKGSAEKDAQGPADAGDKPDAETQTEAGEELKVVVSIKGVKAVIGVQQPSSDPHFETFDDTNLSELAHQVPAVTERAGARWEETPKHPAYVRPTLPARRRNRRRQGAAQASNAEGTAEPEQPQTPRLF